jgi:hypothetical protein
LAAAEKAIVSISCAIHRIDEEEEWVERSLGEGWKNSRTYAIAPQIPGM